MGYTRTPIERSASKSHVRLGKLAAILPAENRREPFRVRRNNDVGEKTKDARARAGYDKGGGRGKNWLEAGAAEVVTSCKSSGTLCPLRATAAWKTDGTADATLTLNFDLAKKEMTARSEDGCSASERSFAGGYAERLCSAV